MAQTSGVTKLQGIALVPLEINAVSYPNSNPPKVAAAVRAIASSFLPSFKHNPTVGIVPMRPADRTCPAAQTLAAPGRTDVSRATRRGTGSAPVSPSLPRRTAVSVQRRL
jgi:hypothetical protein